MGKIKTLYQKIFKPDLYDVIKERLKQEYLLEDKKIQNANTYCELESILMNNLKNKNQSELREIIFKSNLKLKFNDDKEKDSVKVFNLLTIFLVIGSFMLDPIDRVWMVLCGIVFLVILIFNYYNVSKKKRADIIYNTFILNCIDNLSKIV